MPAWVLSIPFVSNTFFLNRHATSRMQAKGEVDANHLQCQQVSRAGSCPAVSRVGLCHPLCAHRSFRVGQPFGHDAPNRLSIYVVAPSIAWLASVSSSLWLRGSTHRCWAGSGSHRIGQATPRSTCRCSSPAGHRCHHCQPALFLTGTLAMATSSEHCTPHGLVSLCLCVGLSSGHRQRESSGGGSLVESHRSCRVAL